MKKITIYTMESCPFCERAKGLFQSKGYAYEERKLDMDDEAAWSELEAKTHYKAMPQIFIGEKFIGGYSDIAALEEKGKLATLVEDNT